MARKAEGGGSLVLSFIPKSFSYSLLLITGKRKIGYLISKKGFTSVRTYC